MSVNFPTSLDTTTQLPQPSAGNFTNSPSHAGAHDNESAAIIALETKLGITASTPSGSNLLVSTGTGTSTWSKVAPTGAIVGISDSQTLTNKTLTSPTINTAVISNPTLTVDSISGYSVATNVTVGGVTLNNGAVGASTLTSSGLVTASNGLTLASGTLTLPNKSITAVMMLNGLVANRQGNTTGDNDWIGSGTNNTDTSAKNVFIQVGEQVSSASVVVTVTFPVAFTKAPLVFMTCINGASISIPQLNANPTTTNFTFIVNSASAQIAANTQWWAVGQ